MHIRDITGQKLIMQFSMKQCKIPLSFFGLNLKGFPTLHDTLKSTNYDIKYL